MALSRTMGGDWNEEAHEIKVHDVAWLERYPME